MPSPGSRSVPVSSTRTALALLTLRVLGRVARRLRTRPAAVLQDDEVHPQRLEVQPWRSRFVRIQPCPASCDVALHRLCPAACCRRLPGCRQLQIPHTTLCSICCADPRGRLPPSPWSAPRLTGHLRGGRRLDPRLGTSTSLCGARPRCLRCDCFAGARKRSVSSRPFQPVTQGEASDPPASAS